MLLILIIIRAFKIKKITKKKEKAKLMKKKKIEIFSQKTEWIFGVNYSFKKLNIFSEIKFWDLRAVGILKNKKIYHGFMMYSALKQENLSLLTKKTILMI